MSDLPHFVLFSEFATSVLCSIYNVMQKCAKESRASSPLASRQLHLTCDVSKPPTRSRSDFPRYRHVGEVVEEARR